MRVPLFLAFAIWLCLPFQISAQSGDAAARAHRPIDAINAFIAGCVTANGSKQRAEAAFQKNNLAIGISNRPNGDFPAGLFLSFNAKGIQRTGKVSECRVRIRNLWLSSADPVVTKALKAAGFTQVKRSPATERRSGMRIQNGTSAGLYSAQGKMFIVQVAQVRQQAGRLTELSITQIADP